MTAPPQEQSQSLLPERGRGGRRVGSGAGARTAPGAGGGGRGRGLRVGRALLRPRPDRRLRGAGAAGAGHEASGTIRAVGAEVRDRTPGQRVALEPQETCGRCRECLSGRYNLCPDVQFFATPPIHGAFAQYVVLDAIRAHPVPDSLSDEAAALIEPLSVGVWAARKADVAPGDRVLVTGAGPVGLLCADVARARGAAHVAVSDTNPARLAVAAARGSEPDHRRVRRRPGGAARTGRCGAGVQRGRPGRPRQPSPSPLPPPGSCWSGWASPTSSCRSRRSSSASWWSPAPSATPTATRPPSPWRPAGWSTWTGWSRRSSGWSRSPRR